MSPKQCECGRQGYIVDSRQHKSHVSRRYECECGTRWSTTEVRCRDDNPEVVMIRKMKDDLADQLIAMAQEILK